MQEQCDYNYLSVSLPITNDMIVSVAIDWVLAIKNWEKEESSAFLLSIF